MRESRSAGSTPSRAARTSLGGADTGRRRSGAATSRSILVDCQGPAAIIDATWPAGGSRRSRPSRCTAQPRSCMLGLAVARARGSWLIGVGGDSEIFVWSFAWWPHAIGSRHRSARHARHLGSRRRSNLAWVTSVPGAALLFWPLTAAYGPVAAYNVAIVACPALAAFGAYLLARELVRAVLALAGRRLGLRVLELPARPVARPPARGARLPDPADRAAGAAPPARRDQRSPARRLPAGCSSRS